MKNVKNAGYKMTAVGMAALLTLTVSGVLYAREGDTTKKEDTVVSETTEETKEEGISLLDTERKVGKEETVYVLAGADGAVEKVIVSNWLKNPDKKDMLEDDSELENIVNVKGEESYSINKQNMKVWEAEGQDIYYQGTTAKSLPVDVAISYQLDGKSISADKLAGKSGKVTMRFDYTNNQRETVEVNGSNEELYVPFLMVSGMILDNHNFSNIQVSNGKLINDGDRSIVAGFAMPGLQENLKLDKEKMEFPEYVEITADVEDFELAATLTLVTNEMFNSVDLENVTTLEELESSFNTLTESSRQLVDGSSSLYEGTTTLLNKSEELVDGVDKLFIGAEQLKNGAAELDNGASKLKEGTQSLNSGAKELNTGAGQLAAGAPALSEGVKQLQDGLGALAAQNDTLNGGARQVFQSLIDSANSQLTAAGLTLPTALTIENYDAVLIRVITAMEGNPAQAGVQGVLNQLRSYQTFYDGLNQYTGGVATAYDSMVENKMAEGAAAIAAGAAKLAGGTQTLLAGSESLAAGAGDLKNGTASLASGTAELYNGIGTLKNGSSALIDGVDQLNDGAMQLSEGMKKFDEEGIQKLADAYNGDIKGLIERMKATVDASGKYQTFSGKAEDVEGSVQFIFRTEGIEAE